MAKIVADKAKKKEWEPLKYAADAITYSPGSNKQNAIDWLAKAYATKGLNKADSIALLLSIGDANRTLQTGGGNAMSSYEKVTDKDPQNSLAYSKIGALWYAAKNYKLALENYNKAKDADPNNPLPYRDLANAYMWTGKYDLAKQNIQQYLNLSDKSTEDQIKYGDILYLSKDYQGAIDKINELIRSGISKPRFYGILAYSQMNLEDSSSHAQALENVRKYFSMQKQEKIFPSDYSNYGTIVLKNNLTDSADYYFNKSVTADTAKDKSETYRLAAEAFKNHKDYAKSAEWYNKLIVANPETEPIDYFWRGAMYYYSKNYTDGARAFEEMETKYPDQPSATYWRGRVAAATDEEAKTCVATPHYTKWLEKVGPEYDKKSDLMQAYQYLALCAYNKGDKVTMKTYMDKIEAIDAGNAFLKQLKDLDKQG